MVLTDTPSRGTLPAAAPGPARTCSRLRAAVLTCRWSPASFRAWERGTTPAEEETVSARLLDTPALQRLLRRSPGGVRPVRGPAGDRVENRSIYNTASTSWESAQDRSAADAEAGPHRLLPARLTGKRRRGTFAFTLRTFATTGHPPAGLALEVTGQAQTRRGCLILHRQVGLPAIRR